MSPELHRRIRQIFDEVVERPETQRRQFLEEICGPDEEVFRAVARLLEVRGEPSFLDRTSPALRHFGRYIISGELGRGAMGIVYKASDPLIGRTVAIKIIHLESLSPKDNIDFMSERLFREARSAGRLSHPGIVTIFDVGLEGNQAFVAMEYVDGPTLQQMLGTSRRLDCDRALDILRQTAAALDYAHQNGVIHRDVKPANIMVHENTTVKITDFGIAKVLSGPEHTRTGIVLGTPSCMSPEQIGARPLDGRSDQFSLAAMAFQLLTGVEPFESDSLPALLQRILYEPRLSACALNRSLPFGVDSVLHRGLEKSPVFRYETCTGFFIALESALLGSAPATSVPAGGRQDSVEAVFPQAELPAEGSGPSVGHTRRRRLAFYAMLGTIAICSAVTYLSHIQRRPAQPPPQAASESTAPNSGTPSPAPQINVKQVAVSESAKPAGDGKLAPDDTPSPAPQSTLARRLYDLAIKYREEQRTAEALDLFRRAASYGDARAMAELGEMLMNDPDGDAANYSEALRWLREAADAGDSSGMVDLGGMYLLGRGIDEDVATAALWFGKAAAVGDPAAMFNLGMLYESGTGVPRDRDKAVQLLNRAAALGNEEARRHVAELEK